MVFYIFHVYHYRSTLISWEFHSLRRLPRMHLMWSKLSWQWQLKSRIELAHPPLPPMAPTKSELTRVDRLRPLSQDAAETRTICCTWVFTCLQFKRALKVSKRNPLSAFQILVEDIAVFATTPTSATGRVATGFSRNFETVRRLQFLFFGSCE